VRQFPLPALLPALERLLARGLTQFKFVDRTFNLNLTVSKAILQFFLARYRPGLFVHFEMVPDRLPDELRQIIARFPAGALQFEVGIQTFNAEVTALIQRRQDYARLADNLTYLRQQTGVHIHADLIIGLPGESVESFGAGFDRLVALRPHEIQVGILKRLRGTPIARHADAWQMIYNPEPPYDILQNKLIDFPTMQRLRRFARFWDLIANSGNFIESTPLLWQTGDSAFARFLELSDWLHSRVGRQHSIALLTLMEGFFVYLTERRQLPAALVAASLWHDYQRGGRRDQPGFLQAHLPEAARPKTEARSRSGLKRQARHSAPASDTAAALPV